MGIFTKIKDTLLGLNNNYVEVDTSLEREYYFTIAKRGWTNYNRFAIDEIDTFELGDSTKLRVFYTKANISQYPSNYIQYRNCVDYFWSRVAETRKMKATTSNLVRNISITLSNITNTPEVYSSDDKYQDLLQRILKENDFLDKLYDRQKYKTLVQGWGAYRIDIDTERNSYPKIRYFDAHNSFCIKEEEDIVAIVYTSHYRDKKNRAYLLMEIRYVKWVDGIPYSCIDKKCFDENNLDKEFDLKDCEFLQDKKAHHEFPNVPFILGEFSVFYEISGLENEGLYGRSIFYGKIDALDDYDQALSIASTATRRSLPKTTYPVESVGSRNGRAVIPNDFQMDYLQVPNLATSDGRINSITPQVLQPQVDLKKYDQEMEYCLEIILGGIMSLNDIGLNEQTFFRDSAEAIRERSRQTLYTITYVRKKEEKILLSLFNKCLYFYEMIWENKNVSIKDFDKYNVQVHYDKFLSPSKEQKIKVYLPMYQSGAISIEKFVRTVYEDEMSEEDMQKEIDYLELQRALARQNAIDKKGSIEDKDGAKSFQDAVKFEKTSAPYQDEVEKLSDNSGMNNHNRSLKDVKNI